MSTDTTKEAIIKLVADAWADGHVWTAQEVATELETSPEIVESVIAEYNVDADVKVELSSAVFSHFEDPDEQVPFIEAAEAKEEAQEVANAEEGSLTAMIVKQLAVSAVVFVACVIVSYLVFE